MASFVPTVVITFHWSHSAEERVVVVVGGHRKLTADQIQQPKGYRFSVWGVGSWGGVAVR